MQRMKYPIYIISILFYKTKLTHQHYIVSVMALNWFEIGSLTEKIFDFQKKPIQANIPQELQCKFSFGLKMMEH